MRTVLYANPDVSDYLKGNFVLLWTSERPVPRITVDYGDGRTLERTITGNSVHYVLDQGGAPIDAIPGLYHPDAFRRAVEAARGLHDVLEATDVEGRGAVLRLFHRARELERESELALAVEARRTGSRARRAGDSGQILSPSPVGEAVKGNVDFTRDEHALIERMGGINAISAIRFRSVTKAGIELGPAASFVRYDNTRLEELADAEVWRRVAYRRHGNARVHPRTILLMSRELDRDARAMFDPSAAGRIAASVDSFAAEKAIERATSKSFGGERNMVQKWNEAEQSLLAMAGKFAEGLAEDTVRNELLLHERIHERFADSEQPEALESLNNWVYREIFLTPRSDPWLGLAPPDYSGISGGGKTGP